MNRQTTGAVEISVRLYCVLLRLYPAKHREEYGWLMAQLFRDKATDAFCRAGEIGIVVHWLAALLDLIPSILQEWRDKDFTVSDSKVVEYNPYLLMASGALFAWASFSQLQPDDHYTFYGLYAVSMLGLPAAIVTLAAGLHGLRRWLYRELGRSGRTGTFISVFGGGAAPIFMFMLPVGEPVWSLMMLCVGAMFGGFILLGVDVLLNQALARWTAIPLVISGIAPFIVLPLSSAAVGPRYLDFAGMFIVGVCWLLLGNYLRQMANERLLQP